MPSWSLRQNRMHLTGRGDYRTEGGSRDMMWRTGSLAKGFSMVVRLLSCMMCLSSKCCAKKWPHCTTCRQHTQPLVPTAHSQTWSKPLMKIPLMKDLPNESLHDESPPDDPPTWWKTPWWKTPPPPAMKKKDERLTTLIKDPLMKDPP